MPRMTFCGSPFSAVQPLRRYCAAMAAPAQSIIRMPAIHVTAVLMASRRHQLALGRFSICSRITRAECLSLLSHCRTEDCALKPEGAKSARSLGVAAQVSNQISTENRRGNHLGDQSLRQIYGFPSPTLPGIARKRALHSGPTLELTLLLVSDPASPTSALLQ